MTKDRERQIRGKNYSVNYGPIMTELWTEIDFLREENKKLKREVNILRQYGNKDCTAQADERLEQVENKDD